MWTYFTKVHWKHSGFLSQHEEPTHSQDHTLEDSVRKRRESFTWHCTGMVTSITLLGPRLTPSELQQEKHHNETRLKQLISEKGGKKSARQAIDDLVAVADWL